MSAAAAIQRPDATLVDHRVYLYDVPWEEYEALLRTRGESNNPRITYLEGTVELMAPSRYHELDKKRLARLIETWAYERGVALEGYGSWTVKNRHEKRGAEADESGRALRGSRRSTRCSAPGLRASAPARRAARAEPASR